ncbi:MAG: hypothetical protein AAFV87_02795 [Pseudomonadota bacterium]
MRIAATCIALALPCVVSATTYCSFEQECFEADACGDAAFLFEYTDNANGARLQQGVTASTEFGDLGGYVMRRDETSVSYAFEGPGAMYFLTVEDAVARLSVHMEGPIVVTYLGRCEGL